jgi:hypothetical protein
MARLEASPEARHLRGMMLAEHPEPREIAAALLVCERATACAARTLAIARPCGEVT